MGSTPLFCAMQNALGPDVSVGLQIDSITASTQYFRIYFAPFY